MSQRRTGQDADSERLPWIEPYKEASPDSRPAQRQPASTTTKSSRAPSVAIGAVVLLTVGIGGGYWLGQRTEGQSEQAPAQNIQVAEATTAAVPPVVTPQPEPEASPPAVEPEAAPPAPAIEAQKPSAKAKPPAAKAKRKDAKKIRHASTKRSQYDRVVAKQREAARTWPKMPSPGPAGEVIQLGAFSTRSRAGNAYRERLARYPVLSGMPHVIVPVITQPRGEILYVLRLGTQSREQSNVVCRNLRTSGDHCLVIG